VPGSLPGRPPPDPASGRCLGECGYGLGCRRYKLVRPLTDGDAAKLCLLPSDRFPGLCDAQAVRHHDEEAAAVRELELRPEKGAYVRGFPGSADTEPMSRGDPIRATRLR
jgi:hypothetical protein